MNLPDIAPAGVSIVPRLESARRVAVFTHQRPDPDALGSQAAMAIVLRRLGAEVTIVNFDDIPRVYAFLQENLEGAQIVRFSPEWAARAAAALDTILVVDTCAYQQLEPAAEFLRAHRSKIVVLDHHLSRDPLSDLILSDTKAAAAAEIVWEVTRAMEKISMDAALALPLMAGLVADTGWFRFDSVTRRTHWMAADLTPHLKINELYERLQQCETASKLALMQRSLANLRWLENGKGALMILSQQDFADTGALQSQTEELVNLPLMVRTIEVAALATEMPDGRIRVSLRSKHLVDVNQIGRQFNGGGHAKAAGCRLDGPLSAAAERLAAALTAAVAHLPSAPCPCPR